MADVDAFDPEVVRRLEVRVASANKSTLTAQRLDGIVLREAGLDVNAELRDAWRVRVDAVDAHRARLKERFGVRRKGGPLAALFLVGVMSAASAASTVFGRRPLVDHPELLHVGALVPAAAIVLAALICHVRPAHGEVAHGMTTVWAIYAVSGVLGLVFLDLTEVESARVVASIVAGLLGVLWLHGVRWRRRDAARELDLAHGNKRRRLRRMLAEEHEWRLAQLEQRLLDAGADLDALAALRAHAQALAEARGITGLEPAPGPVGATILAGYLTYKRDFVDDGDENDRKRWCMTDEES